MVVYGRHEREGCRPAQQILFFCHQQGQGWSEQPPLPWQGAAGDIPAGTRPQSQSGLQQAAGNLVCRAFVRCCQHCSDTVK